MSFQFGGLMMKEIAKNIPVMCFTAVLITEIVMKSNSDTVTATLVAGVIAAMWGLMIRNARTREKHLL